MLFIIYVSLEPFASLIGVFSILLCLAKLLNQYYYSFPGTRSSLFSITILLTWYVYLLNPLVLPFLLLLLNCVYLYTFATEPLVLFNYYWVYLHFKLTVLRYVSPYSYFLNYLWSGTCVLTPQPLVPRKSYSARCYSTTSYAPTTVVLMEPPKTPLTFSFPGLPSMPWTLFLM
jgi:hypothetical protein